MEARKQIFDNSLSLNKCVLYNTASEKFTPTVRTLFFYVKEANLMRKNAEMSKIS